MQKINLNIIVRSGNYMNVCFCSIRVSKEFLNIYIYIYMKILKILGIKILINILIQD